MKTKQGIYFFNSMRPFVVLTSLFLTAGCVDVPPGIDLGLPPPKSSNTPMTAGFDPLDPGAKEVTSVHFLVKAYGSEHAEQISKWAEEQYNHIMGDTNLFSFSPHQLYSIMVYANKDEYMKKTKQPDWSGGVTVANSIWSFDGDQLQPVLAHEMTHLIFHEYMGSPKLEFRWLNEGLAVYEESAYYQRHGFTGNPLPFDSMITLVPASEKGRTVDQWYQQVGEVVRFMVERGGRNGFGQFLSSVRDGKPADEAMRLGFPGIWMNMQQLETAWKASLH